MVLDKIMDGYVMGVREIAEGIKTGKPFVIEHLDELGGKEYVGDPLVQLGGFLAWFTHPALGTGCLVKRVLNCYQNKD
ncbi:hypothetical protein GOV03_03630 [Candidatus Woesearchaeota archaeon]|nr:hypothetical protein [Candidatus Woesearchaeota archaeon]